MKNGGLLSVMALTGVIAALATNNAMAERYGQPSVKFLGDSTAKTICMAIVRDDVVNLRRSLKVYSSNWRERAHESYECNEMPLDQFALTQDAANTSEYLEELFGARGTVRMEQVGSVEQ